MTGNEQFLLVAVAILIVVCAVLLYESHQDMKTIKQLRRENRQLDRENARLTKIIGEFVLSEFAKGSINGFGSAIGKVFGNSWQKAADDRLLSTTDFDDESI